MGSRVRVNASNDLEVAGHGTIIHLVTSVSSEGINTLTMGTLEGAGPAYLYSLRQALITLRRRLSFGDDARVWVGLIAVAEEDLPRKMEWLDPTLAHGERRFPPSSPSLVLSEDRLLVRIEVGHTGSPDLTAMRRLLAPLLRRHGATAELFVEPDPDRPNGVRLDVDIARWPPRGATVEDAWRLGEEAQALLTAAKDGEITRPVALDLLRSGRWDLFVGQPESDWLEAKGEPYDHLSGTLGNNWSFELAKDVAAFANSPEGGIIAIGMTTRDDGDGDVIDGHKEFDLRRVRGPQYRKHVARLIYPRVAGFEVLRIKGSSKGRGFAVLVIPPQPDTSRPFLVQGMHSQGKLLGSHILLPFRREDDTAFVDIGAIHARLRLGEQAILGPGSGESPAEVLAAEIRRRGTAR